MPVSPTKIESEKESVKQKPGILDEKEIPQAEEEEKDRIQEATSAPSPLVDDLAAKKESLSVLPSKEISDTKVMPIQVLKRRAKLKRT